LWAAECENNTGARDIVNTSAIVSNQASDKSSTIPSATPNIRSGLKVVALTPILETQACTEPLPNPKELDLPSGLPRGN